jgi:hypothetical protein
MSKGLLLENASKTFKTVVEKHNDSERHNSFFTCQYEISNALNAVEDGLPFVKSTCYLIMKVPISVDTRRLANLGYPRSPTLD